MERVLESYFKKTKIEETLPLTLPLSAIARNLYINIIKDRIEHVFQQYYKFRNFSIINQYDEKSAKTDCIKLYNWITCMNKKVVVAKYFIYNSDRVILSCHPNTYIQLPDWNCNENCLYYQKNFDIDLSIDMISKTHPELFLYYLLDKQDILEKLWSALDLV